MCCGCSQLGYVIGNSLYVIQKLASCCALTAVVACLISTLIVMLGIGVGLGYHYCIVQEKTYKLDLQDFRAKWDAGKTTPEGEGGLLRRRSGEEIRSFGKDILSDFLKASTEPINIKPTMVVPLDLGIDFTSLLAKIRAQNKNVTVELVAK